MILFLVGIAILIAGYFIYGRFIERHLAPDDRDTPAKSSYDGVDFLTLPHWKNMLIQLLNIAGVGPVIGVILGIKFGSIVFVIIPLGNVFGGAVHDYIAGHMALRSGGANLPILIKNTLGKNFARFFSCFVIFLLFLVVAVFINIPAGLTANLIGGMQFFWVTVAAIFLYYTVATLFPIDKIIGNLYPLFGAILLLGTGAIFVMLMIHVIQNPALLSESEVFREGMETAPVIPMLFVTIACGILSGFHATQSPIVARTMSSERQARATFYGMMILEGIIAMVWAGAGMAIYNLFPELMQLSANTTLVKITDFFLGSWVGTITIISVIILAITSGDTAMRSLRLSFAELFKIKQKPLLNRLALVLPMIIVTVALLWWSNRNANSFAQLWRYFAWGNQCLGATTLMAGAVWLMREKSIYWISLIPGIFMCFIVFSYIFWISPERGGPVGLGYWLSLPQAYLMAAGVTLAITFTVLHIGGKGFSRRDK